MTDKTADKVIAMMGLENDKIQLEQTAHRLKLIDFWKIKRSARVLEIGCGQGDTLSALAYTVEKNGFVRGVDTASESYGAPETLGQARDRLKNSPLGDIIQMDFDFDIVKRTDFCETYDYVVLSHCLWYFSLYDELLSVLRRVYPLGEHLCIAEWNPDIKMPEQLPHLQAVTVQAICECFTHSGESNVRTMFYPSDIERAITESGWKIQSSSDIFSPGMQDGYWEVANAANYYPDIIASSHGIPEGLKILLLSQLDALKRAEKILPMSAYCCTATKNL